LLSIKRIVGVVVLVIVAAGIYFGFFGGGQAAVSKTFHYETAPSAVIINEGATATRTFTYKPVTVGSGETAVGTILIVVASEESQTKPGQLTVILNDVELDTVQITGVDSRPSVDFDPSILVDGSNSVKFQSIDFAGQVNFDLDVKVI